MIFNVRLSNLIALFSLACFLFTAAAPDSHAQRIKELFDKEMPTYDDIPDDKFEAMTYLHEDVPFGDSSLAYKIRLPNDWSSPSNIGLSNYNLSSSLMGDIALFYSGARIDAPRSKFEIKALKLDFEITAEQWLLKHVLSNGYTLEGLQYFNEDRVGALYIYVVEGETYVVRSIAQINGKRMIVAQYVVPARYWKREAPMIAESLATYELLNPQKVLIENMEEYLFLDITRFEYPESWTFKAPPARNVDRMEVMLNNLRKGTEGILDGQIYVQMVSSYVVDDLENELDNLKAELRKKGLLVGELIESKNDIPFSEEVEFGFVDIFEGTDTENNVLNYEIWIAVLALKDYYVFATLVTPHRDNEFFTWSRNFSAYKRVLKTIKLQENSLSQE